MPYTKGHHMGNLKDDIAGNSAAINLIKDPTQNKTTTARQLCDMGIETSASSVRRLRNQMGWQAAESPEAPRSEVASGAKADLDATGATVYHDSWPVELGDNWDPLLEFFGLDPACYVVEGDSVKIGKWQTSKGYENGDRDVVWLYSYRARFSRLTTPLDVNDDIDSVLSQIRKWKSVLVKRPDGGAVSYVHQQGDEQIGKSEGGGLTGVIGRVEDGIAQSHARMKSLLDRGINITDILDVANGDVVENIFGHYPSQARTTDTLRKQFKVARDLDLLRTETFSQYGLPISKVYTTSNHGEIRQVMGMAPFTSESDNLDLIIAESVKAVLDRSAISDQLTWYIPHDEWWSVLRRHGVGIGVTHGHKAKGTLSAWVRLQRDYLNFHHDFKMNLALLGHKHHFYSEDLGGTTIIQTPSVDGGSPYFEAMSGTNSKPGVVTYIVGSQFNQGFSELVVL